MKSYLLKDFIIFRAIAQAVSCWFPTRWSVFELGSGLV
jgi:hypothetical protein